MALNLIFEIPNNRDEAEQFMTDIGDKIKDQTGIDEDDIMLKADGPEPAIAFIDEAGRFFGYKYVAPAFGGDNWAFGVLTDAQFAVIKEKEVNPDDQ